MLYIKLIVKIVMLTMWGRKLKTRINDINKNDINKNLNEEIALN